MLNKFIRFFLENKLVAYLLLLLFIVWGLATTPFDFGISQLPRDPVAVDAIPDIGENQQIVFTKWPGRSPQDVEDQISYPLTTSLLGIPGVKSIRSNSMFGFSSIYIIFDDQVEFYWSRSRILEKLNSLPANTLPPDAHPSLGPDATALGQIFWYTLEGRDSNGNPTGGWDLQELRSIQDFHVRYGLSSAEGVAEVASIGGFVKEYQVDVDPEAMKVRGITLEQVMQALKNSNIDVGAQTIEINLAEYFVRGLGYVKKVEDIEGSVIKAVNNVPVRIGDVARVSLGPATRRGVLDKSGAEAVGGVVVARFGANPQEVIQNVKKKIAEIEPGLASKTLPDGTQSQVHIVPFYDRTQLINETIGTLQEALSLEILITILVVILMLLNLRSSILVSATLPVAVLMCFIAMRYFGVDANIVALSGIAIAIGTMVDMGIVLTESMIKRMEEAPEEESLFTSIYEATTEVSSAVLTAVATTIISFIPVFAMEAAEGKLFKPLAYTKSFALVSSIVVAITILPSLAHSIFSIQKIKSNRAFAPYLYNALAVIGGGLLLAFGHKQSGGILLGVGLLGLLSRLALDRSPEQYKSLISWVTNLLYAGIVAWLLASLWMPLGVQKSTFSNFLFIALIAGGLIGVFYLIIYFYERILRTLLEYKGLFLLVVGLLIWQGFRVFKHTGEEFMPSLDEGSYLLMPTSMPHAGMQENIKNLRLLDMAVTAIPEVESVVGKAGRVNSALDPAPMSMYENIILYKSEYATDEQGHRVRFKYENGEYKRDAKGALIPDPDGQYFRQWREHIKNPDDIWKEIVHVTELPGITPAPKLQPIETRLIMLQTGMRAPMGIKIRGTDLSEIEAFGIQLEHHLKSVEGVKKASVFADRIVGKPYLLLDIDRERISRYGLSISTVQQHIQAAIGGMAMSTTVEGRERYTIRVRYPRELRNDPEALQRIYIATPAGQQVPLGEMVTIRYEQGAQSIKSEDGFLIGYVLFDREKNYSEVEVVHAAQRHLDSLTTSGILPIPAGINYRFAGNYEQQVRANERLWVVMPIALAIIFLILYFQFRSIAISLMVFTGVFIAFAGGFIMIGLYDTDWFLNFSFMGTNLRDLFQIQTINLSVAVWVGFLALFGIATDDGVLVATFLKDSFQKNQPTTVEGIRSAVVDGGMRRVRPAMMTTATTILALLPVLSSTGRGADIMLPMAIPSFGGMSLQIITMFTVPVLFSMWKEWSLKAKNKWGIQSKAIGVLVVLLLAFNPAPAQSLDSLVQIGLENNLQVKILHQEYLAALERAPQLSQHPDPEWSVSAFPLPVETRLGPQLARAGVTQMLPWPGLLERKASLENAKAKAIFERIEARSIVLVSEIKLAYLSLYEMEKSQEIIEKNIVLLDALEALSMSKTASGQASTADALRVQIQLEALRQEIQILNQAKRVPVSQINQLLNRPVETPIMMQDSFSFAELPYNKEQLVRGSEQHHPALRMYQRQQEIAQTALALNAVSNKPSFGIGMDYLFVNKRTDADPQRNGRDVIQLRASVKLPLHQQAYEAKAREEQLRIASLENQKADALSGFAAHIEQAFAEHETARLRMNLVETQIELTDASIRILQTEYSSTGAKFEELLRLEAERIQYDLNRLKAVVQSQRALVKIEQFIF
jgi:Cu(I)/Ag(I) efflux system membrane protein CusA/SilA